MDLSVILCTWNNGRRLAVTLDALRECAIPANVEWELVLVNNNCTDETPKIALRCAATLPIHYVEEPRQGLSRARNAGLNAASGRLVVFTDDDVRPCSDWLLTYWRAYQERPSGFFFGGPIVCEYEGRSPEDELLRLAPRSVAGVEWGPREKPLPEDQYFMGANWACPADALSQSGGFDIDLGLDASLGRRRGGEEWDLMDRLRSLGMAAWYLPRAWGVHFVPQWKCGREHIGALAECLGMHSPYSANDSYYLRQLLLLRSSCKGRSRRVLGVPWKLYAKTADLGVRWRLATLRGAAGYEEYVSMRFLIGVMKGHRQRARKE